MMTASILSFHSARNVVSGKIFCMPRSVKLQQADFVSALMTLTDTDHAITAVACKENILWEHEARIDQNISIIYANKHAVHSNLPKAPHWQDSEWRSLPRRGSRKRPVGLVGQR